jgi:hypothetical protein
MSDLLDKIIKYECGELSEVDTISLFSELIKTGQAWSLQGHYGRTAKSLIDQGLLDNKGKYTDKLNILLEESV